MRTVLLEDVATARRLTQLLSQHPAVDLVAQLTSVAEGIAWFGQHPAPDLILADIQLADGLSFEIFDAVAVCSPIIFTTDCKVYALQVFDLQYIDYLLQPVGTAHLSRILGKPEHWLPPLPARVGNQPVRGAAYRHAPPRLDALPPDPPRYRQRFLVSTGEQLLPVAVGEVAYFFTTREVVYLVRYDGRRFGIDYKLDQLEKTLDPTRFFRVNRQYLVPFSSVDKLYPHPGGKLKLELKLAAPDEVLVSRERAPMFKRWLEEEVAPE